MHHKIISKKIFHSFTRYIKYRFTVSSPLFKFHNATRRNSTYPVCNNVSKRWIDFFPNKMLLRICFKISNSCSSTYSWPSNAGKVNAFVISDLKHSTTRGKMCARALARQSKQYIFFATFLHNSFSTVRLAPFSFILRARHARFVHSNSRSRDLTRLAYCSNTFRIIDPFYVQSRDNNFNNDLQNWKNLTKSSLIVSE